MEHKIAKCVVKTLEFVFFCLENALQIHARVCDKMGVGGRLLYEQKRFQVFFPSISL